MHSKRVIVISGCLHDTYVGYMGYILPTLEIIRDKTRYDTMNELVPETWIRMDEYWIEQVSYNVHSLTLLWTSWNLTEIVAVTKSPIEVSTFSFIIRHIIHSDIQHLLLINEWSHALTEFHTHLISVPRCKMNCTN